MYNVHTLTSRGDVRLQSSGKGSQLPGTEELTVPLNMHRAHRQKRNILSTTTHDNVI